MDDFDWTDLIYGGDVSSTLSPSELVFAGRDSVWEPSYNASGFWDTVSNYADSLSDWLGKHDALLKWGAAGLGGLASYLSALEYNKLIKAERDRLNSEIAARAAEAKRFDAPRNFKLARVQTPTIATPGMEAVYFKNNALSANPSTVQEYANGGAVEQHFPPEYYSGGVINLEEGGPVPGNMSGQSDKIPAMLSSGEWVADADTVAALGDGNTAAGVSALEQMRRNVRAHKRKTPVNKIPPKAKKPIEYMRKGAK